MTMSNDAQVAGSAVREPRAQLVADLLRPLVSYIGSDHCYRFVNRAYEQFYGREASWYTGKHVRDVLGDEAYERRLSLMPELLAGREILFESPLPPNILGRRGTLRSQVVPDFDAVGGFKGIVVLSFDVTAQKQAEERLRMASLSTLAAGVAHELNNPLTYVTSNLETLEDELQRLPDTAPAAGPRELLPLVREAREGAERMRKIVGGLRVFSCTDPDGRPDVAPSLHGKPFDVRDVLEQACRMVNHVVQHRARLVKDFGDVPRVTGDEARLGQALMHLLVNAAQAMPEGRADENMLRVVTTTAATKRAVVEVHDTGGGIPEDAIRRIFDPFFTTRGVGEGVGLGLSVCHGTVLSFGGHIEVESEVGKGTVFRITLPPAPIPPPPPSAEGLGPPSAPFSADDLGDPDQPVLRRGKVLLVDDDDLVGITLTRALRKEHDVTLTTNGKQALDLLVSGERFDVILCDLMMPVMTGMALYAELTARVPEAVSRIVFVTGGAFTSSAEAFLGRVKNERLEKPFDRKSLRDLVRKYVA